MFVTNRLTVRDVKLEDLTGFYDLHSNQNVMNLIPADVLDFIESENLLKDIISKQDTNAKVKVYSILCNGTKEFIGT